MQNSNSNSNSNTRKLTKAQLVRDQISLVKQANTNATLAQQQQSVVQWAVTTLAFKKQLAKVYVSNNWTKA